MLCSRNERQNQQQMTLCSFALDGETLEIGNAFVRKLLRHTCSTFGGIGLHSTTSPRMDPQHLMQHDPDLDSFFDAPHRDLISLRQMNPNPAGISKRPSMAETTS